MKKYVLYKSGRNKNKNIFHQNLTVLLMIGYSEISDQIT